MEGAGGSQGKHYTQRATSVHNVLCQNWRSVCLASAWIMGRDFLDFSFWISVWKITINCILTSKWLTNRKILELILKRSRLSDCNIVKFKAICNNKRTHYWPSSTAGWRLLLWWRVTLTIQGSLQAGLNSLLKFSLWEMLLWFHLGENYPFILFKAMFYVSFLPIWDFSARSHFLQVTAKQICPLWNPFDFAVQDFGPF